MIENAPCGWCSKPKPPHAAFCGQKCRQAAWRFRGRLLEGGTTAGGSFARASGDASPVDERQLGFGFADGTGDASPVSMGDAGVSEGLERRSRYLETPGPSRKYFADGECWWCGRPAREKFCSPKCRHISWRRAKRTRELEELERPIVAAYFDPPYPGHAWRYRDQESYAGEVDHCALIAEATSRYEHWALSTSWRALRDVLPLCPPEVHLCPWVKPNNAHAMTFGLETRWEALIVFGGRQRRPGKRDWLLANPAHLGGSTLIGRKPIAFWAFLFRALGLRPGDTFEDRFPGSGMGGAAWREFCRGTLPLPRGSDDGEGPEASRNGPEAPLSVPSPGLRA